MHWLGEKEDLINSHKTYYLPAGTTLHDLGLRPGTSHTWEDDVFGTVKLLIQPEAEDEIPKSTTTWHGWPADAPPPEIAPFDADQAKWHQDAWAKHLGVPVECENSIGMKFRLIPLGEFLMGSTPEDTDRAFGRSLLRWA